MYQVLLDYWQIGFELIPQSVLYREKQEWIPNGCILVGDDLTLQQAIDLHDEWYSEICRANETRWNRGEL